MCVRWNPFFEHADAQLFLAWRRGAPVGRITAQIDHRFNEFQATRWGMFGFFECVRDQRVASALLTAVERWLRGRAVDRIVGPLDFSTNHEGHRQGVGLCRPGSRAGVRKHRDV
jgi:acetyltransferase (GNAT) family protein